MKDLNRHTLKDLQSWEVEPPAEVWQNISIHLDKKNRNGIFFFLSGMAASLLLILSIGGYHYYSSKSNSKREASVYKQEIRKRADTTFNGASSEQINIRSQRVVIKDNSEKIHSSDSPLNNKKTEIIIAKSIISKASNEIEEITNQNKPIISRPDSTSIVIKEAKENPDSLKRNKQPDTPQQLLIPESDMMEEKAKSKKWNIGAQLAPLYTYRTTQFEYAESGIVSYSGGMNVNYLVTDRWSIQSGLYYSKYGQAIGSSPSLYNRIEPGNSIGTLPIRQANNFDQLPSGTETKRIQNFHFIDLPVIARYKLIDQAFDISVAFGGYAGFLFSNSLYDKSSNDKVLIGQTENINKINYSGTVGIGFEKNISKHLLFGIEPRFRYFINSINTNNVSTHPYSFGIFSGLTYKF